MDGFRFRHATGSNRIITFLCRQLWVDIGIERCTALPCSYWTEDGGILVLVHQEGQRVQNARLTCLSMACMLLVYACDEVHQRGVGEFYWKWVKIQMAMWSP